MAKQIFIIRHGETDFNLKGIVQGRGVDPSLNETGRMQAQLFYDSYKDEPFDVIYTSTLRRTHETVSHFINNKMPWEQHAALDEISWGIFEGKHASREFKMLYRELISEWNEGNLEVKAVNGESPVEVQRRQLKFIDYLVHQPAEKVLICMHGRAMRIFIPTLLALPLTSMNEFPHHNLTLYKLLYNDQRFTIDLFNNMDHLSNNGKN